MYSRLSRDPNECSTVFRLFCHGNEATTFKVSSAHSFHRPDQASPSHVALSHASSSCTRSSSIWRLHAVMGASLLAWPLQLRDRWQLSGPPRATALLKACGPLRPLTSALFCLSFGLVSYCTSSHAKTLVSTCPDSCICRWTNVNLGF